MKWGPIIRIAALISLLGVIALCTLLYVLAGTTRGSRWLLKYTDGLSDAWNISARNVSGSLLYGLTMDGLLITVPKTVSVNIETLHLEWNPETLFKGEINLSPLEAKGVAIDITTPNKPSGNAPPASQVPQDLRLPLGIALENVLLQDIAITTHDAEFHLPLLELKDGSLGRTLDIRQLNLTTNAYAVTVQKGRISAMQPFATDLEVDWRFTPPNSATIEGHGKLSGNLETLNIEHTLTAPVTVESRGTWRPGLLTHRSPDLTLENKISNGQWTYGQDRAIRIPAATVDVRGWLNDYSLAVNGRLAATGFPELGVELTGNGNLESLHVSDMTVHGLNGTASATGEFAWRPKVSWDLQLRANHIDPGVYWKNWAGDVNLQGGVAGELAPHALNTRLHIASLTGTLRNYPLQASGNVALQNGQWSSRGLELRLGKNTLAISGTVGETIAAQWDARIPNLKALWPALSGQLVGQGVLEGKTAQLNLTGKLQADKLEYENYRVDYINISAASSSSQNPSGKNFKHSIRVEARDIEADGFLINNFQSALTGDFDNHRILATVSTPYGTLDLQTTGHWQAPQWQATVDRATLHDTAAGTWQLQAPSSLSVSSDNRSLTRTCWQQDRAEACVSGSVSNSEMDVDAVLHALPLNLAKPWLPVNMEIDGRLNGRLQASGPLAEPTGMLTLQPEDGRFFVKQPDGEPESYAWRNAGLTVEFANGAYHLTAGLELPQQGKAAAEVKMNAQKQLDGTIDLHFTQLAWLEAWTPALKNTRGALNAELNLTGTLEHPQWLGTAGLYEAATAIPALGIELKEVTATLKSGGQNRVSIEGTASSGPGQIRFDGQLNTSPAHWQLNLDITGNRFEAVNTPEAHVLVTPDLVVNASNQLIDVKGAVKLPEVDIQLKALPSRAVKVSEDTVIVNETETGTEQQAGGIPIKTNIKLILGDKVHFKGFGFEARLSGNLELVEEPGQPTLAYGTLTIDEGHYKAYGQNLSVEQGKLIFQGPYDDPGLDIRAVRKTPDVTVGLNIGGTLKNIRSTVFSEPALPESEAIAILLTGKRLSNTNKSEANFLVNAIASLGIKKSKSLTNQLSETFGLDVLTIESGGGLEESSLTIGKYLTPRLYVKYAIGLFDQLTKLALEYRLTEHVMVEAESGQNQSMDIIYRIER